MDGKSQPRTISSEVRRKNEDLRSSNRTRIEQKLTKLTKTLFPLFSSVLFDRLRVLCGKSDLSNPVDFSEKFCAYRNLICSQKRFYQLAFAADNHSRKTLEPFAFQDFRFGVEPVGQQTELFRGDFSQPDSVE